MRIGIDLDNTIIDYSYSFFKAAIEDNLISNRQSKSKKAIKSILISRFGENVWTKLQGKIYGEKIMTAKKYKNFDNFVNCMSSKAIEIFIVSHKTKYPFLGKKIDLHNSANLWIKKNIKNKIKKKNIYFETTLNKKIKRIKSLKLDYFIDDLEKVLNHKNFPENCNKILFGFNKNKNLKSFSDWKMIIAYFRKNYIDTKICNVYSEIKKKLKKSPKFTQIIHNGNQKVFKFSVDKKYYVLKLFFQSKNKNLRFYRELYFYKFMKKNNNKLTPKLIHFSPKKQFLITSYILHRKNIKTFSRINYAINFIKKINSYKINNYKYLASDTSKNLNEYIFLIEDKLSQLKQSNFFKEKKYLFKKIEKTWNSNVKINLKKNHSNILNNKFLNFRCLSPSDLSFNNMLVANNKGYFIDFEHAGIDDPVKLINDFLIHPKNNISKRYETYIIKKMSSIFDKTDGLQKKVIIFKNYFKIRWIFIILNIFVKKNLKRRIFSNSKLEINIEKNLKIKLAKNLLKNI